MEGDYSVDIYLRHICEICDKEEILTVEEGYRRRWNYPPKAGPFRALFPRTCGKCLANDSVWWDMILLKGSFSQITERQERALRRILNEPKSILPHNGLLK